MNEFQPTSSNTLVLNMQEFEFPAGGVVNYRDWRTKPSVPHNRNWNDRPARTADQIRQIAIHETGAEGPGAFAGRFTAHLAVLRDGTIQQFNDLFEIEFHLEAFNGTSIGIEFANLVWDRTAASSLAALQEKFRDASKYLPVFWGEGRNVYTLPSMMQLEKLVDLLVWLVSFNHPPNSLSPMPVLDPAWFLLVSYDDVSTIWDFGTNMPATPEGRAEKRFFIMTKAYGYLTSNAFRNQSGILSHASAVRNEDYITSCDHSDGALPALYAWLRMDRHRTPDDAYALTKSLMATKFIKVKTRTSVPQHSVDSQCTVIQENGQPKVLSDVRRDIVLVDVTGV